jgi:hypothetical protein
MIKISHSKPSIYVEFKIQSSKKNDKMCFIQLEFQIRIPCSFNLNCTMLTEPQVHLLISMSSHSIGMIHIPLVTEHNDPSERRKKPLLNHTYLAYPTTNYNTSLISVFH